MYLRSMKKSWMVKAVLIGALVILGASAAFMLVWNWLVPTLFRGPTISIGQALGLLVLTKLLLGGWARWGRQRSGRRAWKQEFEVKWNKMTPEEQARVKRNFTHQCRHWRWSECEADIQETKSDQVKAG